MTILVLDKSNKTIAQSLDDYFLNNQIKQVALCLYSVWHIKKIEHPLSNGFSLTHLDEEYLISREERYSSKNWKFIDNEWSQWTAKTSLNNLWMMMHGKYLIMELMDRQGKDAHLKNEFWPLIYYAVTHPSHYNHDMQTPFPLSPKSVYDDWHSNAFYSESDYRKENAVYLAYRDYYLRKLRSRLKCKKCLGNGSYIPADSKFNAIHKVQCEDCDGAGYYLKLLTFTNREKPEWIKLKN